VLISFKLLTKSGIVFLVFLANILICMNNTVRYIITTIAVALLIFMFWYFSNIVVYIIVSLVLALIGRPLFDIMEKVRIRKFHLPGGLRAILTIVILFVVIFSFFGVIIPLIVSKVHDLSAIDPQKLTDAFRGPVAAIERIINNYIIQPGNHFSFIAFLQNILSQINIPKVAGVFGTVAGWLGNISVAIFSIVFITFFFLKDDQLFSKAFLTLIPDKYTGAAVNALQATRKLLTRYFIGVLAEVTAVVLLSTIGLMIIGFPFKDALVVGFLAGIFNIIPYLGPIIGTVLGVFTGLVIFLTKSADSNLLVVAILIIVVFTIVQLIDNMVIQPFIYSNSVNAHPLEIFLVFLMAGSIGGLAGMILAVPAYTVIRVFAKEYLNNFKLVRSLTKNL
jgi:predicted PurR-regulated permease PerM